MTRCLTVLVFLLAPSCAMSKGGQRSAKFRSARTSRITLASSFVFSHVATALSAAAAPPLARSQ